MAHKIIAAGHICMDMSSAFSTSNTYAMPGDLLQPGKLIQMREAVLRAGGSTVNTGITFQLLGGQVNLMGKIGADPLGSVVKGVLEAYHAADGLIVDKASSTAYSLVLQVPGTDSFILHSPGANDTFASVDVPDSALMDAELFHFGYPPVMRKMYENDGVELVSLFRRAKAFGCVTSLDLSSLDPDSEGALADWPLILSQVLPYVDFFIPRFNDLCWILNRPRFNQLTRNTNHREPPPGLDLRAEAGPLAQWAIDRGCGAVLVKCGVEGLYLRTAPLERVAQFCRLPRLGASCWASREVIQPSYTPDFVKNPAGAGDACIAAFLTAMLDGEPPESCVLLGGAEGACCVSTEDVFSGLLTLPQLKWRILAEMELHP